MIHLKDIIEARERITGLINYTHLHYSETFSQLSGNKVYLKPENLQKTGSFKIRGALNYILQLEKKKSGNGIIASSSGNHGIAVSRAAAQVGYPTIIVMPKNASKVKVAAVKVYGANVVFCGTMSRDRVKKAQQLAIEQNMIFVHDHTYLIAGYGTIGLEILEDLSDLDMILVPVGSGSLISGIATAIKEAKPEVKVYGVEPAGSNSMYLSIKAGRITQVRKVDTIADGLRSDKPGELSFPVVQKYVDDIFLVTEEEIKDACLALLERSKLLVEPSGAVTVAAILSHKVPYQGKKIVAVISGGNVDLRLVAELINRIINNKT